MQLGAAAPFAPASAAPSAAAALRPAPVAPAPASSRGLPPSEPAAASDQNARFRQYMEDAHAIVKDLEGMLFCAVYDGHGGSQAVEFVQTQLDRTLRVELRQAGGGRSEPAVHAALQRTFQRVDRMLMQTGAFGCGTTAALALLDSSQGLLHVANVGDTRAVLVGTAQCARRLSVDHVPTSDAEAQRLRQEGVRVANGRVNGSLAVSRALGDHNLKGATGGVSCAPHVVSHTLQPTDRAVVLASDGLWDVVGEGEAQDAVLQALGATPPVPAAEIADRLVRMALSKGTKDNVCALVLPL